MLDLLKKNGSVRESESMEKGRVGGRNGRNGENNEWEKRRMGEFLK